MSKAVKRYLDTYCTATITVTNNIFIGQIIAAICHTHYEHNTELGHIK